LNCCESFLNAKSAEIVYDVTNENLL